MLYRLYSSSRSLFAFALFLCFSLHKDTYAEDPPSETPNKQGSLTSDKEPPSGSSSQVDDTQAPRPSATPAQEPPRCMITLTRIDVFKRKLNYQLWDSIEQPAPELLARIKVNREVVFERLLAEDLYALDLNVSSEPFLCDELSKGLHITIFDQDKEQTREPVGELTFRLSTPRTDPLRLNLSGGAVRQLLVEVVELR